MKLLMGLILGAAFGAAIRLSGGSSHTKIINALRLKDLTTMKLILNAIGVHLLDALGLANMKVKDLYLPGLVVQGLIFGVGFAVTGYCSGSALAAAAEGKPDARAMVLGGLMFAFMFPDLETYVRSFSEYGPVTIHGSLGIQWILLAAPLGVLGLWLAAKLPTGGGAR
jgi:hypothetical protein